MAPKLYGIEHILYLVIVVVIGAVALILLKKFVKTDKQQEIMFRILGGVGLAAVILNRMSLAFIKYAINLWQLIPDSYCGMTSLLLSISLLFFKKDNIILHGVWLVCIAGTIATHVYPDFLGQDLSFFYLPTISGLFHHSISLFNIITVLTFGYMRLTIKKSYAQAFAISIYLLTGLFLIYVAKFDDAFSIKTPVVEGTPLYMWLLMIIYTSVYFAIMVTIELIRRHKQKKATN